LLTDNERYDQSTEAPLLLIENLIYYGLSTAVENAISLSSGFWVGFHKPLVLLFFLKSLMRPPLRLFFGVLLEFVFLFMEEKLNCWIQRSVLANKVLDSVVWGGEQKCCYISIGKT
jgi:hypothetical protein